VDDRQNVAKQYSTESRLQIRRSIWRGSPDGRTPHDVAASAVRAVQPRRVLEVGCGTGAFADRIAEENRDAIVVATDQSPRLVELAGSRGLRAQVANIEQLPFSDGEFDVVVALWMLYHVSDLDRGLSEVRRVLRKGGRLVAATNGQAHLAQLLTEAGGTPFDFRFSRENGADILGRYFADVAQEDISTRAHFADHASAVAYLATFDEELADTLPYFPGSREYAGATTVLVAT
jgi:ubiquinone/menaquinone biosynthesis C-methylase UbiE